MLKVETGINNEILREKSEVIKLSEIKKYEKL
jgi:hypothetical protein